MDNANVAKVDEAKLVKEPGMGKRFVLIGDRMMLTLTEVEPGFRWTRSQHPEEEIVYVLRGRLEYDDGRKLDAGMATINFSNQSHPGKAGEDEPAVLLEIYSPPPEKWRKYFAEKTF